MISNPQGRGNTSPKVRVTAPTENANRRVSPKVFAGGAVATRTGPNVVNGGRLSPTGRSSVGSHSRRDNRPAEYKSRRQPGSPRASGKRLVPRDQHDQSHSNLAVNIHIDRGTSHGRHDRYAGRHHGRSDHSYYGHDGYISQTYGYPLSQVYYPSYASSYYGYGLPYRRTNRGWSVGINLGGLNFGYPRYKYDYGYNYNYGCRYDGYSSSYYPSYSYTPYRYGYRGYGLTNYSPVYYPTSTVVYPEPVVGELDPYYYEDDEDDPFHDVGYGWFDYSSYDYLYEWPVWRWYSTSTTVPLSGLSYYRTCGPY